MDGHTKGFIFILHQHSQICSCYLYRHEKYRKLKETEDHDLTEYTLFMASSSSWKVMTYWCLETTQPAYVTASPECKAEAVRKWLPTDAWAASYLTSLYRISNCMTTLYCETMSRRLIEKWK
jgi:hypothetical protein